MDPETSQTLLNILRGTLYLVEYYGKPIRQVPALCDVESSIVAAIAQLEAADSPALRSQDHAPSVQSLR